jgi:hypothetical protein
MSSSIYVIDRNVVLQNAYNLTCVFFANKEIVRRTDPDDPMEPLRRLEAMFFESVASPLADRGCRGGPRDRRSDEAAARRFV